MAKITPEMLREILIHIGGSGNVSKCGNCMTRLRLTLHNEQGINKEALKRIDGVLGVIESNDQLQLVLGPGKAKTAAEMMQEMLENSSQDGTMASAADLSSIARLEKDKVKGKQGSSIQKFMATFATIFTPLIPGFIAAGLLLGIATLLKQTVHEPSQLLLDVIAFMSVFSKGLFSFLSILVGYNAQKAFGGTGVNGAIIASLFVLGYDPAAVKGFFSGMETFFGYHIDPRGNIVGVLIAAIVGAKIEIQIRKVIPDNLDMILTSTLTLLLMGALTFLVIMPLAGYLYMGMTFLFVHLNSNPLGGAVLAGLFLISVMFGVHQGFVPVYQGLLETQGFNSLFPILAMAGAGQVGAALALFVRAKKGSVLRNQISGAIIPGFLGIGEPLIYGVTLPRVKPFITACLGGGVGGFFIGLVAYLGYPIGLNSVFGPSGLVAIPLMTSNSGVMTGMVVYVLGLLIAYVSGFILTYLWGSKGVDLS